MSILVGERSVCSEGGPTRQAGAYRSDNAGTSSDNVGKNPTRRKSKVSYAMSVSVGLVDP